jgi:hypothetical protein
MTFRRGSAPASGYVLLNSGTATSPSRRVIIPRNHEQRGVGNSSSVPSAGRRAETPGVHARRRERDVLGMCAGHEYPLSPASKGRMDLDEVRFLIVGPAHDR